jgi:hypothetical protein
MGFDYASLIPGGIGALFSLFGGGGGPNPYEQNMQNVAGGQSDLAKLATGWGKGSYNLAFPAYAKALQYYTQLMGNTASRRQALAPMLQQLMQQRQGAQRGIERTMAPGGERQAALGDLMRSGYNQSAGAVRDSASAGVQGLAGLAGQGLSQANSFLGTGLGGYAGASGTYANLMGNWQLQNQAEQEMWKNIGGGLAKMFNPQASGSGASSTGLAAGANGVGGASTPMGSYGGIPVAGVGGTGAAGGAGGAMGGYSNMADAGFGSLFSDAAKGGSLGSFNDSGADDWWHKPISWPWTNSNSKKKQ